MLRVLRYLVVVVFCLFAGVVIVSIGIGSAVPALNTVMSPLVCPGDEILPVWEFNVETKGRRNLAHGPDLETRWICFNRASGEAHVAGYRTIFTAGAIYGAILAVLGCLALWRLAPAPETRKSS